MRRFDEVMIVNPSPPGSDPDQGARLMLGYYAEPPDLGYYAGPGDYGNYAEDEWDGYAEPDDFGWYGEEEEFYGEEPELVGWGPLGDYAEEDDFGDYADGMIGTCPTCGGPAALGEIYEEEMGYADGYGYGEEDDDYGWYAEDEGDLDGWYGEDEDYGWYGEDDGWYGEEDELEGYVKEVSPSFNPQVVAATNLGGFGEYAEDDDFAGYVKPSTVNASCGKFVRQPGSPPPVPDTLRPLW